MPNSCFILENDRQTVANLLQVIGGFPAFKWVEHSDDYEAGMNIILKYAPDVVFINVDLVLEGYNDVFAYCREIDEHLGKKSLYIAISKDKGKAYPAIKNKFFDYLLKPGKELDIRKIILRIL